MPGLLTFIFFLFLASVSTRDAGCRLVNSKSLRSRCGRRGNLPSLFKHW